MCIFSGENDIFIIDNIMIKMIFELQYFEENIFEKKKFFGAINQTCFLTIDHPPRQKNIIERGSLTLWCPILMGC